MTETPRIRGSVPRATRTVESIASGEETVMIRVTISAAC